MEVHESVRSIGHPRILTVAEVAAVMLPAIIRVMIHEPVSGPLTTSEKYPGQIKGIIWL